MQSFLERRNSSLDTAQPSIRHIQELIRHKTPVAIQVLNSATEYEGVIRWQDLFYIALSQGEDRPLTLINRETATVIRALA
jgi:SOS-response transcriptional repressor LexA